MEKHLKNLLTQRHTDNLYRTQAVLDEVYLSLTSFDYLGLANHPAVIRSFKKAVDQYGVGSGAAYLLGGYGIAHRSLEEELADFLGFPRVLLFSTGYMANLGVLTALFKSNDHIFSDRLNHASLIDGALYSTAHFERYQHQNLYDLENRLIKSTGKYKLISSDGVFSMDGDMAKIPELVGLAKQYNCWLMIDDAHGIGVLGKNGKGSLELLNVKSNAIQILVGTFGKAFGTFGAFVAGSEVFIESLIQFARSYIYTTALPPAIVEATRVSLKILQEESWRREKLSLLIKHFQDRVQQIGLKFNYSNTPIQPLVIGDSHKAQTIALDLKQLGIIVGLIRPPTVPPNTARLRVSLTANHTIKQVDYFLEKLDLIMRRHNVV